MSNTNLALFPDFKQKLSLLQLLGYIQQESSGQVQGSTVTVKGRVTCEMNTCDELLATEIIFDNILEPLNPPEAAALLSALIFEERSDTDPPLTSRLETARAQCEEIHRALGVLSEAHGLPPPGFIGDSDGKKTGLNFGLAAVVYQWARGVPFSEITGMTTVQEGSIVRTITRLDELCRDFRNASRVVGNPHLYRKMEAASQCIRRDIVFAGSLYIN